MNLLEYFAKINTFVFDVDGVMTDGSLLVMPDGHYIRTMDIKDGYALQLAVKRGYNVFVITGSQSSSVAERLKYLGIQEFHQKVTDKKSMLEALLFKNGIDKSTVLFMGDDMPDKEVMQSVAIGCCPADAAIDIVQIAQYISPKKGGKGCVRDVIEKVMKLQGKWQSSNEIKSV